MQNGCRDDESVGWVFVVPGELVGFEADFWGDIYDGNTMVFANFMEPLLWFEGQLQTVL